MSEKIFNAEELAGLQGQLLQQAAQKIKQRFDQKRSLYHQLRNNPLIVLSWNETNEKIIEFEEKFTPWNQQWNNLVRQNNPQMLVDYFNQGNAFYEEMDDFIVGATSGQQTTPELEALKIDVMDRIESDILKLTSNIYAKIDEGINNVIGLKSELGLQSNFKENIEIELTNSKTVKNRFLGFFVTAVIAIPIFLLCSIKLEYFKSFTLEDLIFIRVGVSVALAIISYFCFSQYKLYQLIALRYSHLHGFLGGGATYIAQIIEGDAEIKREINKKLAELFMELEDVFGLVRKNSHPAEVSIEKMTKFVKAINPSGN